MVDRGPPLGRPLTLVHPAPAGPQLLYPKVALPLDPHIPTPLPSGFTLQPVQTSSAPLVFSQSKRVLLPSTGRVLGDLGGQPPLHKEKLNFDPSLIFLESHGAVGDWLGGGRQPLVVGGGGALPYLPPFVSSLSSLSALLRAKNSLTKCSLRLLSQDLEPRTSRARAKAHSGRGQSTAQPPDYSPPPPSGNRRGSSGDLLKEPPSSIDVYRPDCCSLPPEGTIALLSPVWISFCRSLREHSPPAGRAGGGGACGSRTSAGGRAFLD